MSISTLFTMARSIELKGFKEYAARLKKAPSKLQIEADLEASAAAQNIARGARTRAPVNDGALRASIHTDGANGNYNVFASAGHAAYQEFGTKSRANIPPELASYAAQFKGSGTGNIEEAKKFIYEWCRKKGIEEKMWYVIFRSIMTNGIHAHPFLFPSVDEERPKFYERVKKILDRL